MPANWWVLQIGWLVVLGCAGFVVGTSAAWLVIRVRRRLPRLEDLQDLRRALGEGGQR